MIEKVIKCNIKKERGWLYFLDKEGNISRTIIGPNHKVETILETNIKRKRGFLYFIDKDGDIARARYMKHKKIPYSKG